MTEIPVLALLEEVLAPEGVVLLTGRVRSRSLGFGGVTVEQVFLSVVVVVFPQALSFG